jgi:hypothetical protein
MRLTRARSATTIAVTSAIGLVTVGVADPVIVLGKVAASSLGAPESAGDGRFLVGPAVAQAPLELVPGRGEDHDRDGRVLGTGASKRRAPWTSMSRSMSRPVGDRVVERARGVP